MKLLRIAGAIAAATALAVVPPAANAETKSHADATGDVQAINDDDYIPGDPGSAVPGRTNGDITSIRVNHLPRRVLVTLTFRELMREEQLGGSTYVPSFDFRFRTAGLVRTVDVSTYLSDPADRIVMRNGAGKKVSCAMSARIDYEGDFIVLRVPRTCLGTPRWVRAGAVASTTDRFKYAFVDDARSSTWHGGPPALGPRVYR